MPKRVLITGGAGYIGSVLTNVLLSHQFNVRVLDKFSHRNPGLMACIGYEGFEPVRGDCRDGPTLRKCLKDVDYIIPLAAIVGAPACDRDPYAAESINYSAISELLYWRENRPTIFPNTNSGYGTTEPGVVCDEDTPMNPISLYGKTKLGAERNLLAAGNAVSFRLATVFGPSPRMRLDLLVNDFVYRAVRDKALVLYEPHFRRNYMHIYDVARLFLFGIQNFEKLKNKAWNAGLHFCVTKRELCDAIKRNVPGFHYAEAPTGEDPDKRDYAISVERLEQVGFKCSVSLERGIRELIQAYQMMPGPEFTNI